MGSLVFRPFRWLDWLAGVCLFLLTREWLLPLLTLTDTGELTPFYYVIGGVILVDLCIRSRLLGLLIKAFGVLWLIHRSYGTLPFASKAWLIDLYSRLSHELPLAVAQNWAAMSLLSRNLLFALMIMVLVTLLTYLVLEQRQALWFVILTGTFLASLDTFMPYPAEEAIVRTLVAGFLLLAVSHYARMQRFAPRGPGRLSYWKMLLAPLMIVALTVGIAYAGPKQEPAWPDPLQYLNGSGGEQTTSYLKKVGYDNNDSVLGGPFVQDNGPVFTASTNEKTYWRADSKEIYTGIGWQKGEAVYENILQPASYQWNGSMFSGFETKEVRAHLEFNDSTRYPVVFYPGQLTGLKRYQPENATIVYDKVHEQLEVRAGQVKVLTDPQPSDSPQTQAEQERMVPNSILMKLNQYEVTAEVPILSEKKLMTAGNAYPDEVMERYLQVPPTLPPRVKELAEKVTARAKTPYEKVRAVENFLRTGSDYRYETSDVPVVSEGQDFVDQFLFETKRGYCDHFSSSMAVMLRTIGIPTRWVKGFAPGTEIGSTGDERVVQVRNRDAHSWVEVYFPNHGWIPFEATSSFQSPVRMQYDLDSESSVQPVLPDVTNPADRPAMPDRMNEKDVEGGQAGGVFAFSWKALLSILAVLAAGGYLLWRNRKRARAWWLYRRMNKEASGQYRDRYGTLILLVETMFSRRREGETLREYVSRLQISGDKRQDLLYLTQLFERIFYGCKDLGEKAKATADKLMERLVRQLKP